MHRAMFRRVRLTLQQPVGYDIKSVLFCFLLVCCSFLGHGKPCSTLWGQFESRGYIALWF